MNNDDLNRIKISYSNREMTIRDAEIELITTDLFSNNKLTFSVESSSGQFFNISTCWIDDFDNHVVVRGLWLRKEFQNDCLLVAPGSAIAKLLEYYSCENVADLIDTTVNVLPDKNNYLAIVATDIP